MTGIDPADSGASERPEGGLRQASLGRRLFALCLDWLASSLVARLLVSEQQISGWVTLLVFFCRGRSLYNTSGRFRRSSDRRDSRGRYRYWFTNWRSSNNYSQRFNLLSGSTLAER